MALAIALILLDGRKASFLKPVHGLLNNIGASFRYLVDWPVRFSHYVVTSLTSNQILIEQNANLQTKNLLLQARLQKFIDLEKENKELRALLSSTPYPEVRLLVAQVLAIQTEPYLSQIVIDKGQQDGVYLNQAVLDAKGIVGQVIEVDALTSRVLLITDTRNAVPIRVVRNGSQAIALGNGALGTLSLAHIPITADIQAGDILVSSGLGQRYPMGYPVGVVQKVKREAANDFAQVIVEPTAQLTHNRLVMLVWPPKVDAKNNESK
jgi:rod shape-determining protein MreC